MPFCCTKKTCLFRDRQYMCLSLYYSHAVVQKLSYYNDKQQFEKVLINDRKIYILIRI